MHTCLAMSDHYVQVFGHSYNTDVWGYRIRVARSKVISTKNDRRYK